MLPAAMFLLRHHVERRIEKGRMLEAKGMEMRRMLVQHNILAGQARSDIHVEGLRRCRSEAAMRQDLFQDYSYVKAAQEQEKRFRVVAAEESLATALAAKKAKRHREEMDRRRICDGSEQLRALKEKLIQAKVNKERAQQLQNNHIAKDRELFIDHCMAEHMENERLEQIELEYKLNIEKQKQRERVKQINQQQIAQKEALRDEAHEEYLREKDQVGKLVAQIEHEDRQEANARAEKRLETQEALRRFVKEQKERQEQLEQQERDEAAAIEAYARAKAAREEAVARQKEVEAKEKERIFLGQMKKMELANAAKGELEYLRNELHHEEHEALVAKREELAMRKRLEDREEMKNAYMGQMRLKEEKKEKALEEEERMREMLMAKFAEDDRLEQLADAKRRVKVVQHMREANRLIEQRRAMHEEAREQERLAQEQLRAEEQGRQQVIEAERQRLLKAYAVDLKDFLPKGTLDKPEDHEMLFGACS